MNELGVGRRSAQADGAVGYTMVELLAVLVIVAGLVAIVVFSLRGLNGNGRVNSCRSEKRQVRAAVEAFHAEANRYPVAVNELIRNPVTGKGFLDQIPRWYRHINPDGTVSDPSPDGKCNGI